VSADRHPAMSIDFTLTKPLLELRDAAREFV
jgi:hypothetical protein